MKLVHTSDEIFDTLENNIKSLNKILKDWCGKTLSYNRSSESIRINSDILKHIWSQLEIESDVKSNHKPSEIEIIWDLDQYDSLLTDDDQLHEALLINDEFGRPLVFFTLSVEFSSTHYYILDRYKGDVISSDKLSDGYYIVEWKDLESSFTKNFLERARADIHSIDHHKIRSLYKDPSDIKNLLEKIPMIHESLLELSGPKTFVLYDISGKYILPLHMKGLHWKIMDFSQPMILKCIREETEDDEDIEFEVDENIRSYDEEYFDKLLIPSISFMIFFM